MKIRLLTSPRSLPYSNIHNDSAVRVARWLPEVIDAPAIPSHFEFPRLGFPASDAQALNEASLKFEPIDVCFTQVLFQKPAPGTPLRLAGLSRPFMILARVVSVMEAERSDLIKSNLSGFVMRDGCMTDSLSDQVWLQNGHEVNYTVTPGRVGVYVASWINLHLRAKSHPVDQLVPLKAWCEPHPKGNWLHRLYAVDQFLDLDHYRRVLAPVTSNETNESTS